MINQEKQYNFEPVKFLNNQEKISYESNKFSVDDFFKDHHRRKFFNLHKDLTDTQLRDAQIIFGADILSCRFCPNFDIKILNNSIISYTCRFSSSSPEIPIDLIHGIYIPIRASKVEMQQSVLNGWDISFMQKDHYLIFDNPIYNKNRIGSLTFNIEISFGTIITDLFKNFDPISPRFLISMLSMEIPNYNAYICKELLLEQKSNLVGQPINQLKFKTFHSNIEYETETQLK